MTDGQKEQIKLRANALDRMSTACIGAGLLGPLANILYSGNANLSGFAVLMATVGVRMTDEDEKELRRSYCSWTSS
jgi:hypothetical protein